MYIPLYILPALHWTVTVRANVNTTKLNFNDLRILKRRSCILVQTCK